MPHAETGEQACAFVVPRRPEDAPGLDEVVRFLEERELSRRKLPERLEIVTELPVSTSGKVQKHRLVERVTTAP